MRFEKKKLSKLWQPSLIDERKPILSEHVHNTQSKREGKGQVVLGRGVPFSLTVSNTREPALGVGKCCDGRGLEFLVAQELLPELILDEFGSHLGGNWPPLVVEHVFVGTDEVLSNLNRAADNVLPRGRCVARLVPLVGADADAINALVADRVHIVQFPNVVEQIARLVRHVVLNGHKDGRSFSIFCSSDSKNKIAHKLEGFLWGVALGFFFSKKKEKQVC
jgi:hypothetical protein